MARIRTIKPSFWADSRVGSLSWDARLLLIGLISGADDRGRFVATQSSITGYVFPHDEVPASKFRRLMKEITETGIVELYKVDGCQYGRLPKWNQHQKISHPQTSVIPDLPSEGDWE